MKDLHTDSNFPRTPDGRVYHLGLRAGEVANRLITVGAPSRAEGIAAHLDKSPPVFRLETERGFVTFTGRYRGVPVSIASIGMGYSAMDFFIREVRECVNGDMAVIRLGSCGCLRDYPVGSVVVPKACVCITRNYDFDFASEAEQDQKPYLISKLIPGDSKLYSILLSTLQKERPESAPGPVFGDALNASADSFYSSQGRQTSFPDHNKDLIERLLNTVPDLATLEMETAHLFHLAASYRPTPIVHPPPEPPLATQPVKPKITSETGSSDQSVSNPESTPRSAIHAAGAHMVFASRGSGVFITPDQVDAVEKWAGRGVLEALVAFGIENVHAEQGSVWEVKA